MFKKLFFVLGFIWAVPFSVFGWLLGIFLLVTRQVDLFKIQSDLTFIWDLKEEGFFFKKAFGNRGWIGFSLGNNIFVRDLDSARHGRTLKHESKHCHQAYVLGIFFYPVYILESLRIFFFIPEKHSYYDNWFERMAREYAGQEVNIPKSWWRDGPNDRWAWW